VQLLDVDHVRLGRRYRSLELTQQASRAETGQRRWRRYQQVMDNPPPGMRAETERNDRVRSLATSSPEGKHGDLYPVLLQRGHQLVNGNVAPT
jgi:hypothetical protein